MNNHTMRDYAPRLKAVIVRDRDPAAPLPYPCHKCRGKGTLPHYVNGRNTPYLCPDCEASGRRFAVHPAGIPCPVHGVYPANVADLLPGTDRYGDTEPSERRAWEGDQDDTFELFYTGEDWRPVVWRLPSRRGFLAGWVSESSGVICWDVHTFTADEERDEDDEALRDAIREARAMAERTARETDEYRQAWDYAQSEGRKAGEAGKTAGANPYDTHEHCSEAWEEARVKAYSEA